MDETEDRILPKPVKWALITVGTAVVLGLCWVALQQLGYTRYLEYRRFYIPSDSMMPTLDNGEKFFVDTGDLGTIRRGDVLAARANNVEWIKRVAALPGDRIELKHGTVWLNGVEVAWRRAGRTTYDPGYGDKPLVAELFSEQFPGEAKPHRIMDTGPSYGDDYPETTLPAGSYFFLGDNRDNSIDSRFTPDEDGGMGLVERAQIIGRAVLP